jgi:hypothetical protein
MRTPSRLAPLLVLVSLGLLAGRARGDDVVLHGGSRLTGVVLERGPERVRLLLASGQEVELAAADVKDVVADADAPAGDKVVRYSSKPAREGLETALIHYVHPKTGRRVDLVGAVHIADMAYYREVQRLLEAADLVLYELVKDEDADMKEVEEGASPIRDFQVKMASWFGFAFQLEGIAYDRPHFVHADMTVAQFEAAAPPVAEAPDAKKPGALIAGLEGQVKLLENVLKAMGIEDEKRGPKVRKTVKGFLGRMMGAMGTQMGTLLGSATNDLLIVKRNEVAIQRLEEVPESARSVAIFYGAAHLPDMEKRLEALGYERVGARWLLAWDMR